MARLIGIDEAGYGPNLGPLVISAVTLEVPDDWRDRNLWQALDPLVARTSLARTRGAAGGPWTVDDSKAVYSPAAGLKPLECNVLIGLGGLGPVPATLAELWARAGLRPLPAVMTEPWFAGRNPGLPRSTGLGDLAGRADEVRARLAERGVRITGLRIEVVGPERFNAGVDQHGSKAAVLFDAARELLRTVTGTGASPGLTTITIDKHGGRNHYGPMLQDCFPGRLVWVAEEGRARSRYRVMSPPSELHIGFEARADRDHLAVALASMVSKYVREVLMELFNHFWARYLPELRPTAGYPGDAQRFWDQIRPIQRQLGIPDRVLWRSR